MCEMSRTAGTKEIPFGGPAVASEGPRKDARGHRQVTATPKITTYGIPAPNGGRNRSFEIDGVCVHVDGCEDDEKGKALAEFLADAPARVDRLTAELRGLRAALPPARPVRLLGPGCVRFRGAELWLLNRVEPGWSSWGVLVDGWDDLFRRFDARVTGHGRDNTGDYWTVEPGAAAVGGSR